MKLSIEYSKLGIDDILNMFYNAIRTYVQASHLKEDFKMTENELELLYIIRNHENPEKALKIALDLVIDFLNEREAPQQTSHARPPESA